MLSRSRVGRLGSENKQQRGRQVLDETLKALGGERFLAMKDRVETGRVYSFYREQLSGLSRAVIYTRYLTAPDPPEPGKIYVRERQSLQTERRTTPFSSAKKRAGRSPFAARQAFARHSLARYLDATPRNIFYILKYRLKRRTC